MNSRRSFLKMFGLGVVAAPAIVKAVQTIPAASTPTVSPLWPEGMHPAQININARKIMATVDVYEGDFGTLRVVKNRFEHSRHRQETAS